GVSRLRCDLAIRRREDARYRLGILVDRPDRWARGTDELLRLEPGVLRAFGWTITTVLTKEWLADPEAALQVLEQLATPA
ncbi:MAG: hypothetical protein H0T79_00025, partial [Deltaproteobacteria bacterium]|nr:hypothetical protein [Deltaproteobacteria bacterium]